MTRTIRAAARATCLVGPASARVIASPTGTVVVVPPAPPGVVTPQSNATGAESALTDSPTGRPADSISTDSAAAGNANQPSQVAPQGGGGGQ